MAYLAQDLTAIVAEILHDNAYLRWPQSRLLRYLSLGQVQVVAQRPDAYSQYKTMTLAASARQVLPAEDIQLLTVVRNMGTDGQTPGRSVAMTSRTSMDSQLQTWTAGTTTTEIESYVLDERVHDTFYVYPPPSAFNLQVEYVASVRPPSLVNPTDPIVISDIFAGPLIRWTLYMCLTYQMTTTFISYQQGLHHYQLFLNELGVEKTAEDLISPNLSEAYLPRGGK